MDHLPSTDRPCYTIKVPYLCRKMYDGLDFESYPRRESWDVLKLLDSDLGTHSVEELGSFIQNWLYFGVLADILAIIGLDFNQHHYVAQLPSGETVVTSLPLLEHISTWQNKADSLPSNERKAQGHRVRNLLEKASLYVNSMLTKKTPPSLMGQVPDEVTLSILVLGASLFLAASKICIRSTGGHYANNLLGNEDFPEVKEDEDDISTWSEPYWGFSSLSTARLVQQGWCIRDITMLQDLFSPDSIHYVTLLGITRVADHSKCTSYKCIGNHIDNNVYQTQHVEAGCECQLIEANQDQVISILESGGIPIVGFSSAQINHGEQLSVVRSSSSTPYIAISHVWSHGLGNVRKNALQRCQLTRLLNYFQNLEKGKESHPSLSPWFFWLDTLCVPLANDEARKAAIGRLTETYQEADFVLVLDQENQRCPVPTTFEEITMRLSCSDWMRRLWTLEEGVLARSLHIQFLNGVIDLAKEREKHEGKLSISDNVTKDSLQLYLDIEILNNEVWRSSHEANSLVPVSNALRYRSTSREGDEAICIATFLGFHTDEVYDLPPEKRIKYLLSHVTQIPRHILFMSGSKLQDHGYRWAPASFLNRNTSTDTYELMAGGPVPRTSAGLNVEFPGFMIKYGSVRLENVFYMVDLEERIWYKFESARHVYPECTDEPDWESMASLSSPAIVMPRILTDSDEGNSIVCALVSCARKDGETIFARFEARAFVARMMQQTIQFTELYTLLNDPNGPSSGMLAGCNRISVDQSWCIY